jgi:hypothetical protein
LFDRCLQNITRHPPHYVLFLAAESGGRRHNNTSIGARDGGLIWLGKLEAATKRRRPPPRSSSNAPGIPDSFLPEVDEGKSTYLCFPRAEILEFPSCSAWGAKFQTREFRRPGG